MACAEASVRCWHFHCPACGAGDGEFGHFATDDEVHCLVCLEEENRFVVLRRWLAEPDASCQARLRDGLAG
jgi:hypothetical protein